MLTTKINFLAWLIEVKRNFGAWTLTKLQNYEILGFWLFYYLFRFFFLTILLFLSLSAAFGIFHSVHHGSISIAPQPSFHLASHLVHLATALLRHRRQEGDLEEYSVLCGISCSPH